MKDTVVDGETALSEDSAQPQKQDIHAKLYMWRKSSDSELYLGSLNASHSALYGNVEFMLRLVSHRRWLNMDILTKDLFGGSADDPANPFELTALPEKADDAPDNEGILENSIKMLCRCNPRAAVRCDGDKYAIDMDFGSFTESEGMSVAPLLSGVSAPISQLVTFKGLSLLHISEFYRVTAENTTSRVQRVIKIPTTNIPESRESAVVTDAVKDRKGFYQYLAFLLGDDHLLSVLESSTLSQSGLLGQSSTVGPALYERMLRTAASAPQRFAEIDYLVNMISSNDVIPDGFAQLYEVFKKAVNIRG